MRDGHFSFAIVSTGAAAREIGLALNSTKVQRTSEGTDPFRAGPRLLGIARLPYRFRPELAEENFKRRVGVAELLKLLPWTGWGIRGVGLFTLI